MGLFRKLDDRPRLSGGTGNSVGLSKNDEVLDACGLGTVASEFVFGEISTLFRKRGKVELDAVGVTRGERGKGNGNGNGGGGANGFGGLTSVVHEVLNRSLRDEAESERGLVVIIFVCVVLFVLEIDDGVGA